MKRFVGYVRVSTARQGEQGVSLQEQRDAILRYAERNGIELIRWFEERETAAKLGRPVFAEMLRLLRQKKAEGVLIHKIDRGARNLRDWSDLVDLIPENVAVHFVSESLDLRTTGGRLAADVQAVVAAHYVRNLREETRKGFYGRLKQGIYPLPAPLGYLDRGPGKPKEIDPVKGPFVRRAFELYDTGSYTLEALETELHGLGLRNRRGGPVTFKRLAQSLRNPFYVGLIRLRRTGETFPGAHEPLVGTSLFESVQARLDGRTNRWLDRHAFTFRRLWKCRYCGRSLVPSLHKGHVYYRCQTRTCPTISYREEILEQLVASALRPCEFDAEERELLMRKIDKMKATWEREALSETEALRLRLGQVDARVERLTDLLIEGALDKESFERRRESLLLERQKLQEGLAEITRNPGGLGQRVAEFLELAGSLTSQYELLSDEKKRRLLEDVTSNRLADEKKVDLTLRVPFGLVAARRQTTNGTPLRMSSRTLNRLIKNVVDWFKSNAAGFCPATEALGPHHSAPAGKGKEENLAA